MKAPKNRGPEDIFISELEKEKLPAKNITIRKNNKNNNSLYFIFFQENQQKKQTKPTAIWPPMATNF
jgi:hypothetical protein